jgi:hypothetical protein
MSCDDAMAAFTCGPCTCDGGTGARQPFGSVARQSRREVFDQTPATADTALRLAKYFGTSAAFWMGMQAQYDIERTADELAAVLRKIEPAREAKPTA